MRDQVQSPVLQLPLALEAQAIERLRLDIVSLEQLQDASEQVFLVAGVLVQAAAESIEDEVLLLGGVLQVADEGVKLRLVREHGPGRHGLLVTGLGLLVGQ